MKTSNSKEQPQTTKASRLIKDENQHKKFQKRLIIFSPVPMSNSITMLQEYEKKITLKIHKQQVHPRVASKDLQTDRLQ